MASRTQGVLVGGILTGIAAVVGLGTILTSDVGLVGPGSRAPDFEAVNVATRDTITLADYAGDVMLLNVWATWCPPCEEEMPSMQRLHDVLGPEGLKVVAVSIDESDSDHVRDWVNERNLTFDVLHDRAGRIERLYQTTGVPESFVIDRGGVIVKKEIGAREWDHPAVVAMFRRLLAVGANSTVTDQR